MSISRTQPVNRSQAAVRNARQRRGFTLIELLVAITLLSVGALALAGLSATVMRNLNTAAQQTVASALAESRLEVLRSARCDRLTNGTAIRRGMSETWKVFNRTRVVEVLYTVTYDDGRGKRAQVFTNYIPCPVLP